MNRIRVLFLLALACGPLSSNPTWETPCGGEVTVSVAAITLGDDCGSGSASLWAGDCAPQENGGSCGFACRDSSLQLDIVSTAHTQAKLEVRAVRLYDAQTGALVDTLTASNAKHWLNNQYQAWDEKIGPGATVKASYKLSTPSYGSSTGARIGYYQAVYKTQVDVAVDGELRTLIGPDAHREPEVAT